MPLQLQNEVAQVALEQLSFNTVNGKCRCNWLTVLILKRLRLASFNTVNGKCRCNRTYVGEELDAFIEGFNTVNGKCRCNAYNFDTDEEATQTVSIP